MKGGKMKDNPKKKIIKQNNDIRVYSLGGLGVVGMNMYVVESGDEIIIMDAGILFADDDVHGVNYVIPDFTYLKQNEKRLLDYLSPMVMKIILVQYLFY